MGDHEYLKLEDLETAQEVDVREYFLPCDPSKKVRIASVSVQRMREYQEACRKGGSAERRAQANLIADSVVGTDNKPLWTGAQVYETAGKTKTRWFMALVKLVSVHNGAEDEVLEAQAEELEKN